MTKKEKFLSGLIGLVIAGESVYKGLVPSSDEELKPDKMGFKIFPFNRRTGNQIQTEKDVTKGDGIMLITSKNKEFAKQKFLKKNKNYDKAEY